jgi:hypothetical protein
MSRTEEILNIIKQEQYDNQCQTAINTFKSPDTKQYIKAYNVYKAIVTIIDGSLKIKTPLGNMLSVPREEVDAAFITLAAAKHYGVEVKLDEQEQRLCITVDQQMHMHELSKEEFNIIKTNKQEVSKIYDL